MDFIKKGNVAAEMNTKANSAVTGLLAEKSEEDMRIETLIRERFSMSMETALHRKKLMGILPDAEWNKYCTFIQECIDEVRRNNASQ